MSGDRHRRRQRRPDGIARAPWRIAFLLTFAGSGPAFGAQHPPTFVDPPAGPLNDGYVQLRWTSGDEAVEAWVVQLEEAGDPEFAVPLLRYEGPQVASFVSGLPAGRHYYRLRARVGADGPWSAWSAPLVVEILPHSLALAWTLFGLGATLVVSIVGYLFVSDRRVRAEERRLAREGDGA